MLLLVILIVLSLGAHDHATGSNYILQSKSGSSNDDGSTTSVARLSHQDTYHDVDPTHQIAPDTEFQSQTFNPAKQLGQLPKKSDSILPTIAEVSPITQGTQILPPSDQADDALLLTRGDDDRSPSARVRAVDAVTLDPTATESVVMIETPRCSLPTNAYAIALDRWNVFQDVFLSTSISGAQLNDQQVQRDTCYRIDVSVDGSRGTALLSDLLRSETSVMRVELSAPIPEETRSTRRRLEASQIAEVFEKRYETSFNAPFAMNFTAGQATELHLVVKLDSPYASTIHVVDRSFTVVQQNVTAAASVRQTVPAVEATTAAEAPVQGSISFSETKTNYLSCSRRHGNGLDRFGNGRIWTRTVIRIGRLWMCTVS